MRIASPTLFKSFTHTVTVDDHVPSSRATIANALSRYDRSQSRREGQLILVDGGGIRGHSALMIVAAIMRSIVYDDPLHGSLDDVYPHEYFDVIAGAGMGGYVLNWNPFETNILIALCSVLALLLGRLKLNIPDCILDYNDLSAHILRDANTPPICSRSKLLYESRAIVNRHKMTLQNDAENDQVVYL